MTLLGTERHRNTEPSNALTALLAMPFTRIARGATGDVQGLVTFLFSSFEK